MKENILKELELSQDHLEDYIEELLDKIIVIEKVNQNSNTTEQIQRKENQTKEEEQKAINSSNRIKNSIKKECEVELKIILVGNNIIHYGSATKLRQISQLKQRKGTDFTNFPCCHSHAHGDHLLTVCNNTS